MRSQTTAELPYPCFTPAQELEAASMQLQSEVVRHASLSAQADDLASEFARASEQEEQQRQAAGQALVRHQAAQRKLTEAWQQVVLKHGAEGRLLAACLTLQERQGRCCARDRLE